MGVINKARLGVVDTRIILLAIPIILSAVLVFWNLTGLGLSHWDEYNYIETAKWFMRRTDGTFTIYEPPGFPLAVAVFFRIFGVRDYVAIAASGVFAVATVVLVAYVGLRLFRFEVALTAPLLLIVSPLFLTYSRMALTDMAFTFFFSLSLVAMYRAVRSDSPWNTAFAGLALGACTMIKYNGFMPVLVFAFYLLIAFRSVKAGERTDAALGRLRTLLLTCVPAVVLGLLFICFLGISTELPASQTFSFHALRLILVNAPEILSKGLVKFNRAAIQSHIGQLGFFPLAAAPFYLQVLEYFVPIPVLVLAIIGLLKTDLRDSPELFVTAWLLATFFIIASIPSQYSRAILPALPPIALSASLGLARINTFVQSLVHGRHLKFRLKSVTPILLILVIIVSLQGAFQAVSVEHHGYREAGQLLTSIAGNSPVLAQTQLVIGFYHPSSFGEINSTNLAKNRYLVVDFIAVENGYAPTIQQLSEQGRIKLVGTVRADLPAEVYLDWMNFGQLAQWNYTNIQIYEVTNATNPQ